MSTDKLVAPSLPEAVRERVIAFYFSTRPSCARCADVEPNYCAECAADIRGLLDIVSTAGEAAAQQERHDNCHDAVCNGDRRFPRGESGHSCSCRGREERAAQQERAPNIWRPINTAPTDGTILGFARGRVVVMEFNAHTGWHSMPGFYSCKPTHWMPAHPPPTPEDR